MKEELQKFSCIIFFFLLFFQTTNCTNNQNSNTKLRLEEVDSPNNIILSIEDWYETSIHLEGNITITSLSTFSLTKNANYFLATANYKGKISSTTIPNFSKFNVQSSSGISSLIILFSVTNSNIDILWISKIYTTQYIFNVQLSESIIYAVDDENEVIIIKGVTTYSSLTFESANGSTSKFSINSQNLGVFLATLNINDGSFGYYTRVTAPCTESSVGCTAITDEHAQIAIKGSSLVVSSIITDNHYRIIRSNIVLYQFPSFVNPNGDLSKEWLPLNPISKIEITGEDTHSNFRLFGIAVDDENHFFVSGVLSSGSIQIINGSGEKISELVYSNKNGEEEGFMIDIHIIDEENQNIQMITNVGEYSYQKIDDLYDNLWVSYDKGKESGVQLIDKSNNEGEDLNNFEVNNEIPQPVIEITLNDGKIQLNSINFDDLSNLYIAGSFLGTSSSSSIELSFQNQFKEISQNITVENIGFFISKFVDENFEFIILFQQEMAANSFQLAEISVLKTGKIYAAINNYVELSLLPDGIDQPQGAFVVMLNPCLLHSCSYFEFCEPSFPRGVCSCTSSSFSLGNSCYPKECPNDCSGNGECSNEHLICECNDGYLTPDCSLQVLIEPVDSYYQSNLTTLGNVFQREVGNIELFDYYSIGNIRWQFGVGRFSGVVSFGDISKGDKISISAETNDGEIASFVALYDHLMKLQWVGFIRTMIPNTSVLISRCFVLPNTLDLVFSALVENDKIKKIYFLDQGNEVMRLNTQIQSNSKPYFFGRISNLRTFDWAYLTPNCTVTNNNCYWNPNDKLSIPFTYNNGIIYSAMIGTLKGQSGAADRDYLFIQTIDFINNQSPTPIKFGIFGDATHNTNGTFITSIEVLQDKSVLISGMWTSAAILHLYRTLNVSTSPNSLTVNSMYLQFFVASYDLDFNYQNVFNTYSLLFDVNQYSSISLSMNSDINQNYLWLSFASLDNSSHKKLKTGVVQLLSNCTISKVNLISFTSQTSLSPLNWFNFDSNLIIDFEVDFGGDVILISKFSNHIPFTIENSTPYLTNSPSTLIPNSYNNVDNNNNYYLMKISSNGNPLFVTPISFSTSSNKRKNKREITNNRCKSINKIRFDHAGRIVILGSLEEIIYSDVILGMVVKLDGNECNGCEMNGWCYFDQLAKGKCQCNMESFGNQCKYSYHLPFSKYLKWGVSANSIPSLMQDSSDETIEYYGISVNTKVNQVAVGGYMHGQITYSEFLSDSSKSIGIPDSQYHYHHCFISSFYTESGAPLWTSFATYYSPDYYYNNYDQIYDDKNDPNYNKTERCYIWKIDNDPYTGMMFAIGWANLNGTLKFYNTKTSGVSSPSSSDSPALTISIPTGGSMFFASINSTGDWIYAETLLVQSSCFYAHNCSNSRIISSFPYDVQGDIKIRILRENGGIDAYITGSFLNAKGYYDAFARRYNLYNDQSRPSFVWDCIGYSDPSDGHRGGIALSLYSVDSVAVTGSWTPPRLLFSDSNHNLYQYTSLPGMENYKARWEVLINDNGQLLWCRSSSPPSSSDITSSVPFDILYDNTNFFLATFDTKYNIEYQYDEDIYEVDGIDSAAAEVISFDSNGNPNLYSISASPITLSDYHQPEDLLIYALSVDLNHHLFTVGQQKVSSEYSLLGFIPSLKVYSLHRYSNISSPYEIDNDYMNIDSSSAIFMQWDLNGNPLFLIHSQYGSANFIDIVIDNVGNLYLIGQALENTFFDSIMHNSKSALLLKFSACEDNCNYHGTCIMGSFGQPGYCNCFTGWDGSLCDIPKAICSKDEKNRECNGRGVCIGPNMCTCSVGWSPPDCSECDSGFQPPNCNSCLSGLAMPDCVNCVNSHYSAPVCDSCVGGWQPPDCNNCGAGFELPDCVMCKPGYLQPYCLECAMGYELRYPNCISTCSNPSFAPPDCNTCIDGYSLPDCRCKNGYTGNSCNDYTCMEINNCGEEGVCTGPNECFCTGGYEGDDCSTPPSGFIIIQFSGIDHQPLIVSSNESLLLDASYSYDRIQPGLPLFYHWDCIDLTYPDRSCVISPLSSESMQYISPNTLLPFHNYIFKVTAQSSLHQSSNTVEITVNSNTIPQFDISTSPPGFFYYSSSPIYITLTSDEPISTWYWQALSPSDLDLSRFRITNTIYSSTLQIPPQSLLGFVELFVEGITDDNRSGSSLISFEIAQTTGGYCLVDPSDGYQLTTKFNFFCSSWSDLDGGTVKDLQYQWTYFNDKGMEIFITDKSSSPSQFAYLPILLSDNLDKFQSNYNFADDNDVINEMNHQIKSSKSEIKLEAKIYSSGSSLSTFSINVTVNSYFKSSPLTTSQVDEILHSATNSISSLSSSSSRRSLYHYQINHNKNDDNNNNDNNKYLNNNEEERKKNKDKRSETEEEGIIAAMNTLICFASIAGYSPELPSPEEMIDSSIELLSISSIQLNDTFIGGFIQLFSELSYNQNTPFNSLLYLAEGLEIITSSLLSNSSTLNDLNTPLVSSQSLYAHQSTILIAMNFITDRLVHLITSSFSSSLSNSQIEIIQLTQIKIQSLIDLIQLTFNHRISCGDEGVIMESKYITFSITKGGDNTLSSALENPLITPYYSSSALFTLSPLIYNDILTLYKNCVIWQIGIYSNFIFDLHSNEYLSINNINNNNNNNNNDNGDNNNILYCDIPVNEFTILNSNTEEVIEFTVDSGYLTIHFPLYNYCMRSVSTSLSPSLYTSSPLFLSALLCSSFDKSINDWQLLSTPSIANNQNIVCILDNNFHNEKDESFDNNINEKNNLFTVVFNEEILKTFGPSASPSRTPLPSLYPPSFFSIGTSNEHQSTKNDHSSDGHQTSTESSSEGDNNNSNGTPWWTILLISLLSICSGGLFVVLFVVSFYFVRRLKSKQISRGDQNFEIEMNEFQFDDVIDEDVKQRESSTKNERTNSASKAKETISQLKNIISEKITTFTKNEATTHNSTFTTPPSLSDDPYHSPFVIEDEEDEILNNNPQLISENITEYQSEEDEFVFEDSKKFALELQNLNPLNFFKDRTPKKEKTANETHDSGENENLLVDQKLPVILSSSTEEKENDRLLQEDS